MIRKYAATAVLLLALAGCGSSQPAGPGATPSATGNAACERALVDAYRLHQAGVDTGDMPKPAACAGVPDDVYLQLGLQAAGGSATGS